MEGERWGWGCNQAEGMEGAGGVTRRREWDTGGRKGVGLGCNQAEGMGHRRKERGGAGAVTRRREWGTGGRREVGLGLHPALTAGKGCRKIPQLGRVCVKNLTLAFHPASQ